VKVEAEILGPGGAAISYFHTPSNGGAERPWGISGWHQTPRRQTLTPAGGMAQKHTLVLSDHLNAASHTLNRDKKKKER